MKKPRNKSKKSFHQQSIKVWMISSAIIMIVLFAVAFYFISRIGIITGHS